MRKSPTKDFMISFRSHIPDNTIIGSDASMNYFGTLLLKVGAARGYFAQPSYSSIGYIGPAATGICLAKEGRPKGDGLYGGRRLSDDRPMRCNTNSLWA